MMTKGKGKEGPGPVTNHDLKFPLQLGEKGHYRDTKRQLPIFRRAERRIRCGRNKPLGKKKKNTEKGSLEKKKEEGGKIERSASGMFGGKKSPRAADLQFKIGGPRW